MSFRRSAGGCFALASFATLPAVAAPQPPDNSSLTTLRAETRVVQIEVSVTDSQGKPVTDLSKLDFTIRDEGKPRAIDIFALNRVAASDGPSILPAARSSQAPPANVFSNRNSGPPNLPGHSTVILLDQVNAFFEDAGYARQQVLDLLNKLKSDERIALYVIARKRGLLLIQDYTADHALLMRSLSKYIPSGLMPRPGFPTIWPVNIQDGAQPKPPDATKPRPQEYEFIWRENAEQSRLSLQALAEHLALVPGRKRLYWVTQAFPVRLMEGMGKFGWDKTTAALNEANVAVNTVDSRGLFEGANPGMGTLASMQQIAESTGGKAYFGRNDLDTAIADGIEASRTTYTLGFYLADSERDNRFHTLSVKTDRPRLKLLYRRGYYAGSTELPPAKTSSGDMESALLNQVDAKDVDITVRVEAVAGSPRGSVNIRLNLDPHTISLTEKEAGWTGKVEETFVEQNETGNTLTKISDSKAFQVTAADRPKVDSQGVGWSISMPLIAGATKITIIIRDTKTGRVGSLTVPLM